ncbi:DUF3592 domain-containing protein [Hymenobacter perfusus]|uniref:DUF3592 domain-containing protein n=1 Tax=Hymenobacter perfusus TaxID=1236770 RepID=A0A428K9U7_9BACT|nr:DUF3592 domain-containing protein [Hymenobacter perfusus]RSK43288.1 hypothetical protein EI293_10270 [Hymenobacter perfusus]
MEHPYLTATVCFTMGIYLIWINARQLRLNIYLRANGILTSAVITEARLTRERDAFISHFKATYQDPHHRLHEANFSAKDSNEEFLYLVGGEIHVYYDPLRPENCALATDVKSTGAYYALVFGAAAITYVAYMIWEVLKQG